MKKILWIKLKRHLTFVKNAGKIKVEHKGKSGHQEGEKNKKQACPKLCRRVGGAIVKNIRSTVNMILTCGHECSNAVINRYLKF